MLVRLVIMVPFDLLHLVCLSLVIFEDTDAALQYDVEFVARVTLVHHELPFIHPVNRAVLQDLVEKYFW